MTKNVIAIPPGYTIEEQLNENQLTQKEIAKLMELSENSVNALISGQMLLSTDIATKLEKVLGMPAQFWLNLETIYREKIERINKI